MINLNEALKKRDCQTSFEVVIPVVVLEMTVEDFNKREFPILFEDVYNLDEDIKNDIFFDRYVQDHHWNIFKRDLTTNAMCKKAFKISSKKTSCMVSQAKPLNRSKGKSFFSEKAAFDLVPKIQGRTAHFLKENVNLPLIFNIKNKAAIFDILQRNRRTSMNKTVIGKITS